MYKINVNVIVFYIYALFNTHTLIHYYSALTMGKTKQRDMITTRDDDDDDIIDGDIDVIDDDELDSRGSIDDTNEKQDASVYIDDSIGEEREENLSQYELARMERIEHNKHKFEEIFGKSPKDKNFPQKKKLKTKKVNLILILFIYMLLLFLGEIVSRFN